MPNPQVINGFDISTYATDPNHYHLVCQIVAHAQNVISDLSDAVQIDAYIRRRAINSPVTGDMVLLAATQFSLDSGGVLVLLALMQADSMFGVRGEGARTHNPGNVMNYDDGSTHDFGTWHAGVNAVAEWLDKHKVAA